MTDKQVELTANSILLDALGRQIESMSDDRRADWGPTLQVLRKQVEQDYRVLTTFQVELIRSLIK